jgi:hypothetical protein
MYAYYMYYYKTPVTSYHNMCVKIVMNTHFNTYAGTVMCVSSVNATTGI